MSLALKEMMGIGLYARRVIEDDRKRASRKRRYSSSKKFVLRVHVLDQRLQDGNERGDD